MLRFSVALLILAAAWVGTCRAVPRLRHATSFALVPLGAAVLAVAVGWGTGALLERQFGEKSAMLGLFAGYVSGILLGAVGGYIAAVRLRRHATAVHSA